MIICTHRFGLTVLQEDWEASSLESSLEEVWKLWKHTWKHSREGKGGL